MLGCGVLHRDLVLRGCWRMPKLMNGSGLDAESVWMHTCWLLMEYRISVLAR